MTDFKLYKKAIVFVLPRITCYVFGALSCLCILLIGTILCILFPSLEELLSKISLFIGGFVGAFVSELMKLPNRSGQISIISKGIEGKEISNKPYKEGLEDVDKRFGVSTAFSMFKSFVRFVFDKEKDVYDKSKIINDARDFIYFTIINLIPYISVFNITRTMNKTKDDLLKCVCDTFEIIRNNLKRFILFTIKHILLYNVVPFLLIGAICYGVDYALDLSNRFADTIYDIDLISNILITFIFFFVITPLNTIRIVRFFLGLSSLETVSSKYYEQLCSKVEKMRFFKRIKNAVDDKEMINRKYYLAIDIGASSGRHIVGYKDNNEIVCNEVYRFTNCVKELDSHLVWDIDYLLDEVKKGIDVALLAYPKIHSLSIDTWGVDYVLLNNDKVIEPVYAYRDERTKEIINEVHSIIPFENLYKRTGSQFQTFNSIYQLYLDNKNGRLKDATDFLMIPEYLLYRLCDKKIKEFTNATTTGLINSKTLQFDKKIIEELKLPKHLFKKLKQPGRVLGKYKDIKVVLCATHDTASAVEGIPMIDNEPYISSGTWSLLGVKTKEPITDSNSMKANYSNEGGVGYNRYQKNIMGMWVVNELKKELCPSLSFDEIIGLSKESSFEEEVDINKEIFLSPKSMKEAFNSELNNSNLSVGDYFKCAYKSLALSYAKAIKELENNTKRSYSKIYIVGGGAKNNYLNDLTRQYTNKEVIALPIEATALGNIKVQMNIK